MKALGAGKYSIGGNIVHELKGVFDHELMQYDWIGGELSFLKDGKWEAKLLGLQLPNRGGIAAVTTFWGQWNAGSFIGNMFAEFRGDSFEGYYQAAYEAYESDPSTFVEGRIKDHERGVLGIPKLDVISIDANSQKKYLSLLELQVGHYCNLTDDRGVTHSFRMMKCCDDKNMDIELEEQTGQKRSISIMWKEMRLNDDRSSFEQASRITIGESITIPKLFASSEIGRIRSISIEDPDTHYANRVAAMRSLVGKKTVGAPRSGNQP